MQPTQPQLLNKNLLFHAVNSLLANFVPSMTSTQIKEKNWIIFKPTVGFFLLLKSGFIFFVFCPVGRILCYAKNDELVVDHDTDTELSWKRNHLSQREIYGAFVAFSWNNHNR